MKLNNTKPLILLGDNHGAWSKLLHLIEKNKMRDCYIVSVGDLGVGFNPSRDLIQYDLLNREFSKKNINFFGIRGNHDDPSYFTGNNKIVMDNFELIEDYTVAEYGNKTIQFIGGAISIDRTGRTLDVSYWENEGVVFNKDACKKVDILITHTTPSFCFPQQFNEIVYGWAREDAYLIEDLMEERAVMDEIFKLCNPSLQVYGHFHSSCTERINGCITKLLGINELWEYKE